MNKQQAVAKLWMAQVQAVSQITPSEYTNCRTAARMLRYALKMDQMATEHLAIHDDPDWRAIKASAQSLLEELVSTLPGIIMNFDPELDKVDNVISLSEAIVEATKRLEEQILSEKEDEFELVYKEEEFADLLGQS